MNPANANEKRRQKRFIVNVKVYNQDDGELLGYSANMHSRGLMIASTWEIPLLKEYRVIIKHIGIVDDKLVEIPLRIRSLWGGPSNNPDFFHTGFLILDPSRESDEAIMALIEELAVKK